MAISADLFTQEGIALAPLAKIPSDFKFSIFAEPNTIAAKTNSIALTVLVLKLNLIKFRV